MPVLLNSERLVEQKLPPWLRPVTFGLSELLLDLIYNMQQCCRVDLESVHILLCVQDATMRPYMNDAATTDTVLRALRIPDSVRGSISRRAAADKTGLSRETVRRKIASLAALNFLEVDDADRVRAAPRLHEPQMQQAIESGHKVVLRYRERLASFDVDLATLAPRHGCHAPQKPGSGPASDAETVSIHLRPMLFGLTELFLDLTYVLQSYWKIDLEDLHILMWVADATMRPYMLDPETPRGVLSAPRPPDDVRGTISRRTIADRAGLARETVRRKTKELAARGLLKIDSDDLVRPPSPLEDPGFQRTMEEGHRAVLRYHARLARYGIDGL